MLFSNRFLKFLTTTYSSSKKSRKIDCLTKGVNKSLLNVTDPFECCWKYPTPLIGMGLLLNNWDYYYYYYCPPVWNGLLLHNWDYSNSVSGAGPSCEPPVLNQLWKGTQICQIAVKIDRYNLKTKKWACRLDDFTRNILIIGVRGESYWNKLVHKCVVESPSWKTSLKSGLKKVSQKFFLWILVDNDDDHSFDIPPIWKVA